MASIDNRELSFNVGYIITHKMDYKTIKKV